MPKSACTNGSATGIDHMPALPMVLTATANPSRHHAAGVSTPLSWRSCKSMDLPGDEFMTPTSHGPPVSSTLRAPWLLLTNRHVCERLHSVLSTQDLMHQHIRGFDETPIMVTSLGPRCAIAMSTAIIRLPIDYSDPRPSRNASLGLR